MNIDQVMYDKGYIYSFKSISDENKVTKFIEKGNSSNWKKFSAVQSLLYAIFSDSL